MSGLFFIKVLVFVFELSNYWMMFIDKSGWFIEVGLGKGN